MSDNSSGDVELIGIGLDFQEAGFNQTKEALKAIEEELHRLETAFLGVSDRMSNEEYVRFTNKIDELSNAARGSTSDVGALQQQVVGLAGAYKDLAPELEKVIADYESLGQAQKNASGSAYNKGEYVNEAAAGYGVPGGMVGPAEAGAEGAGLSGSTYGVARGVRGIADLARIAGADQSVTSGVVGGADLLYVAQGFQQLEKVFGPLNATLVESGGLIPALTEGLVAFGVPMAGLVGLILPVAAAVIGLGAAISGFVNTITEGKKDVSQAETGLVDFYKLIQTGTSEEILKEKEQQQVIQAANDRLKGENLGKILGYIQNGGEQKNFDQGFIDQIKADVTKYVNSNGKEGSLLGADANLPVAEVVGIHTLVEETGKLATTSAAAAQKITDADNAMKSAGVTANDAAEAGRKKAEADAVYSAQLEADNKLTLQAAKDRKTLVEEDAARQQNIIASLKETDAIADQSAEQHRKNAAAIAEHEAILKSDTDEVAQLTQTIIPNISIRKYETDAIAGQTAAMKDHAAYLEQVNKLVASGTSEQVGSTRTSLQGKLGTAQDSLDALYSQTSPLTDAQKSELEKLKALVVEIKGDLADLDANIAPLVAARDAFKDIGDALADFARKQQALEDGLALASATAAKREADAEQQYTIGSLQDVHAREQIAQDESRKETEIKQQTADKIVDIETKLSEKQYDIGVNFGRQNTDDLAKYGNDQAKLVRQAQYQAEDDQAAHIRRLSEIRTRDDADQVIALQNRNFLSFYQLQLKHGQATTQEDQSYSDQEQKLATHLKRQQNELTISLNQEQKQRLVDYQRKLDDAWIASQREEAAAQQAESRKIDVLRASETQQLQDLTTMETYKIQVLQQGLQNELALLQAQEQAKLQLLANTQAAIIAQSLQQLGAAFQNNPYATLAGAASSPLGQGLLGSGLNAIGSLLDGIPFLDGGGSYDAGEMFYKGNIEEMFSGANGAYSIPGAAMVYPLSGGTATPQSGGGRGGNTYSFTIYAANDPEATAHAVLDLLGQTNE